MDYVDLDFKWKRPALFFGWANVIVTVERLTETVAVTYLKRDTFQGILSIGFHLVISILSILVMLAVVYCNIKLAKAADANSRNENEESSKKKRRFCQVISTIFIILAIVIGIILAIIQQQLIGEEQTSFKLNLFYFIFAFQMVYLFVIHKFAKEVKAKKKCIISPVPDDGIADSQPV